MANPQRQLTIEYSESSSYVGTFLTLYSVLFLCKSAFMFLLVGPFFNVLNVASWQ